MKTILKIAVVAIALVMMLLADVPFLPVQLVPEAQAILGVRRRTAVVAAAESKLRIRPKWPSPNSRRLRPSSRLPLPTAGCRRPAAGCRGQQQAAAAKQQAAATPPPPAAAGKPLPMGTVVSALPPGCVSTPVGGVEYYYCGGNFYRAVFQGNNLVYVTAQPK